MKNKLTEVNRVKWPKTKIRRITFIVMTCVFVVVAVLLFNCESEFLGKWSNFLCQLCVGAATGCFVVALQETVKDEEYKISQKEKDNKTYEQKDEKSKL